MLSLLALTLFLGGLVLIPLAPLAGACTSALGVVLAGKAASRPDDLETGIALLAILGCVLYVAGLILGA